MAVIIVAQTAGFCFGVRRAIERTEALVAGQLGPGGRVVTLGPLVHNPQEIRRLRRMGVRALRASAELRATDQVVVRSHGITKRELTMARSHAAAVRDATCPHVKACQSRASQVVKDGYVLVFVGDAGHPETESVLSHARAAAGRSSTTIAVVSSVGELELAGFGRRGPKRAAVLAQTTQEVARFEAVVSACVKRFAEVRAFNTICQASRQRQAEAASLAAAVDRMVVVGGRDSANTRRLAEICRGIQPETVHVESASALDATWLEGARRIGVTAGASTPDRVIRRVARTLEAICG